CTWLNNLKLIASVGVQGGSLRRAARYAGRQGNVSVHPMHGFSQCTPNIRRVKTPYFQYAITPPIWIQFKLR
ncbi:hypothetical protein CC80DRAFT_559891, partial [Byssothecium circinans]